MKLAGKVAISALILALVSTALHAGTFSYSLDKALGIIRYDEFHRFFSIDLGQHFSSIDSINIHFSGYIYSGSPNITGRAGLVVTTYDGVTNLGFDPAPGGIADGSFDRSVTYADQTPLYTAWRQMMCSSNVFGDLSFLASDNSRNPDGYANITTAMITIVGMPVPEPSSLLAILGGIGGLGVLLRQKRM